jgi:nitrite reductase (cytochrome c-552)
MKKLWEKRALVAYVVVAAASMVVSFLAAALLANIFERKQEERYPFVRLVEVTDDTVDPATWGTNWPRQYDGYRRTADPTHTEYGGAIVGAEGALPPQKAERNPWLTRVFAGYLFAIDFRERRGHAFMLSDQEVTKRNVRAEGKQSGNCLHCHASIMPLYRKLGREALPRATPAEQVARGLERVSEMSYWDAHGLLAETTGGPHPVSCVDCHDPSSMELRVTRPGFIEGIQALAASDATVPQLPSIGRWRQGDRSRPFDPNLDGSRQELRSFVCGQCHVEYFCGKGLTIFFPWGRGLRVEDIEANYDERVVKGRRFRDFVHAETGMDVLKAQHPEFEVWSQGVHAMSGVACADCHMPYRREGALKVSEHWVRSPLLQTNRSCGACHAFGDEELEARVVMIQDRHHALLQRAGQAAIAMLDALVAVRRRHGDRLRETVGAEVRAAKVQDPAFAALGAEEQARVVDGEVDQRLQVLWQKAVDEDSRYRELGELQRQAQWRLDFVASENSMGFHAPQEMARILAESIDLSRQAQVRALSVLAEDGALPATPPPAADAAPAAPRDAGPADAGARAAAVPRPD